MADLFNNYYNNPRKQAIFTNMVCAGASSENDKSFKINDGTAEIVNSKDVLAELKLENITSNVNDWNLENKTLKSKGILYVSGESFGESYKQYGYGYIKNDEKINKLTFCVDYLDVNNVPIHVPICIKDENGVNIDDIIILINNILSENNIPLEASVYYSNNDNLRGNIIIRSLKLAHDFYISGMSYSIITDDNGFVTISDIILENNNSLYIPCYKYRNGAFKGIIVKAEYPKYNNDIKDEQKSLMITHIKDRVPYYYSDSFNPDLYHKHYVDVFGNLTLSDETFNITNEPDMTDEWINDEQHYINYNGLKLKRRDSIGLYGFCNYALSNNLWMNIGELYSIIATDDVENNAAANLNNGIIIYNNNDFDVKLNILTWN